MDDNEVTRRIPQLPTELEEAIFSHLIPTGAVTSRQSVGENPQLSEEYDQFNDTLAHICLASRRFHQIATRILYHTAVLKDIRQLVLFFRTLATTPHLRHVVLRLVWAGFIPPAIPSGEHTGLTASRSMMALVGDTWLLDSLRDSWRATKWPRPGDKQAEKIARHLYLVDPVHFCSGHILGAVLALAPRLQSLFTVLNQTNRMIISPKGRVLRRCPEFSGVLQIPEWDLFQYHSALPGSVPYPLRCRFLHSLKSISIEPHSDRNAESYWTLFILEPLLRSCPSLESIEIKGTASWRELRTRGDDWQPPAVTSDKVTQLVLTRATHPEDNMPTIADTFPKLQSMYAEFVESSHAGTYRAWLTKEHFQNALASLSETLVTLHFTSSPEEAWKFISVEPLLHPVLQDMRSLKHLVVEFAWVFGWENLVVAFDSSFLPRSLVSLHVIDFWGGAGKLYYPHFPGGVGPLEYLGNMLDGILKGCQVGHLTEFRALRVTSSCFSSLPSKDTDSAYEISQESVTAFDLYFTEAFAGSGVELSLVGLEERMVHGQWKWSTISY